MTISNVVLDREKQIVTYEDDNGSQNEAEVFWSERSYWKCCTNAIPHYVEVNKAVRGFALTFETGKSESKPDQVKQERYLKEDGTDTIDKWAATRSHEVFREIMYAQVEKYKDRLGEKDPILEEVTKMADYMNRWVEYEKIWDKE